MRIAIAPAALALLLAGGPAHSGAARQSGAEVRAIVAPVAPGDMAAADRATAALVALGPAALPSLRTALRQSPPDSPAAAVLVRASTRLEWGFDPLARVVEEARRLTAGSDRPAGRSRPPEPILDAPLLAVLPDLRFYALRYPLYPVAYMPPPPLKNANLFLVRRAGGARLVPDADALRRLFMSRFGQKPVPSAAAMEDVAAAWLRLTEEFSQDGWFRFTIAPRDLHVAPGPGGFLASGRAAAVGGNRGEIRVEMAFDRRMRLLRIDEAVNLQPGVRPICQATKLLDPDPIVRRMAEQDLIVMGLNARGYLLDRRAEARPELQRAIDAIWVRIVERERSYRSGGRLRPVGRIAPR